MPDGRADEDLEGNDPAGGAGGLRDEVGEALTGTGFTQEVTVT